MASNQTTILAVGGICALSLLAWELSVPSEPAGKNSFRPSIPPSSGTDVRSGNSSFAQFPVGEKSSDPSSSALSSIPSTPSEKTEELEQHILEMSRGLAAFNPDQAVRWARSLPAGWERQEAVAEVCYRIAQDNPAKAIQTAAQGGLDNGPDDPALVYENLLEQWAGKDPKAALAFAQAQTDPDLRAECLERVVITEAQKTPVEAVQIAMQQIPAGTIHDEALLSAVSQWARQDFSSAETWSQNIPPGPFHDRVFQELAGITQYQTELHASR